jgi:anti-sigma factor RsiW
MSTNDCREFEWMIGPMIDGELPPAEAEAAEGHLRTCRGCTRLAEDFRSFDRLAHRMESPTPISPVEWAKVLEKVRREPATIQLGLRRRLHDWLVPALSLAALLLLGSFVAVAVVHREEPKVNVQIREEMGKFKSEVRPDAIIIQSQDTEKL